MKLTSQLWKISRASSKAASLAGWLATLMSGSPKRVVRRLGNRWAHKTLAKSLKKLT